jgi:hypothetical protein
MANRKIDYQILLLYTILIRLDNVQNLCRRWEKDIKIVNYMVIWNGLTYVRFEVHTTVTVKAAVFLDVILPVGLWADRNTPTFQLWMALWWLWVTNAIISLRPKERRMEFLGHMRDYHHLSNVPECYETYIKRYSAIYTLLFVIFNTIAIFRTDFMDIKAPPFKACTQNWEKRLLASSCLYSCPSVCPSVRMEQLGPHWTDFH